MLFTSFYTLVERSRATNSAQLGYLPDLHCSLSSVTRSDICIPTVYWHVRFPQRCTELHWLPLREACRSLPSSYVRSCYLRSRITRFILGIILSEMSNQLAKDRFHHQMDGRFMKVIWRSILTNSSCAPSQGCVA